MLAKRSGEVFDRCERISEGVTVAVVILMPKGWSAPSTALTMAAGGERAPPSPLPVTPRGLREKCDATRMVSMKGHDAAT